MMPHDERPGGSYRTETIGWIGEHLDHMALCDLADGTLKARRMVLTWLAEYLGHDPATATKLELRNWQVSMLPNKAMIRWRTAMISPYYRFLHAEGIRPDNPAALLPRPRVKGRLPRPIPEDRLFAAIAEAPPTVLPYLLLAGWSGLRAMEIAALHVEHFSTDDEGQTWARIIGKGGGERDVPVAGWAWAAIAPLLPESGPCWRRSYRPADGPVTPKQVSDNSNYYLRVQCKVPDRLHALRHRVATATLRDSKDVRMVQELLGHSNLATLHVYTQVRPTDMAHAVDRLPRPPTPDLGDAA